MDKMKYIKYIHGGQNSPLSQIVIFTPVDSHRDMADKMHLRPLDILSAGFFTCEPDSIRCYGDSISLGVEFHEEDAGKISHIIRGY